MKVFKTILNRSGTQYSIVGDALFYLYYCSCFDYCSPWCSSGCSWSSFARIYGGEEISSLEFVVVFGETPEQVWARVVNKTN